MLTIAAHLLAVAGSSWATPPSLLPLDEDPNASSTAGKRPPTKIALNARAEFDADLGDARVSVVRTGVAVDVPLPVSEAWRFGVDVGTEWSWYDFDGGRPSPLHRAQSSTLGFTIAHPFAETWSAMVRPFVNWSGDPDAEFDDSVLVGGVATVGKQLTETLMMSLGVYASEQFEDDATVFPFATIEWEIDERTTLASRGPSLRLTRDVGDGWAGYVQAAYQSRDYRLADDSAVAGGALWDTSFPVSVGALWEPRAGLRFGLSAGALIARSIEIREDDGDRVFDEDADPSAFVGFELNTGF